MAETLICREPQSILGYLMDLEPPGVFHGNHRLRLRHSRLLDMNIMIKTDIAIPLLDRYILSINLPLNARVQEGSMSFQVPVKNHITHNLNIRCHHKIPPHLPHVQVEL